MKDTKKAGTILVNDEKGLVCLVKRDGYYSFAKGHHEEGESIVECAIRETIEETGHDCEIKNECNVYIQHYSTPRGEHVEAYYYIAYDLGETAQNIAEKDKEEAVWVEMDKVEDTLSYDNLKLMWNTMRKYI